MTAAAPPPLPPLPGAVPVRALSRRGKWLIAGGLAAAIAAIAGFVVLVVMFVGYIMGMIKGSEPYRHALGVARADARVVAALGRPITDGAMPAGNLSTDGDDGSAELQIPLRGPRGTGSLHVEATRADGRWSYTRLEVEHAGRRIDLRDPAP